MHVRLYSICTEEYSEVLETSKPKTFDVQRLIILRLGLNCPLFESFFFGDIWGYSELFGKRISLLPEELCSELKLSSCFMNYCRIASHEIRQGRLSVVQGWLFMKAFGEPRLCLIGAKGLSGCLTARNVPRAHLLGQYWVQSASL